MRNYYYLILHILLLSTVNAQINHSDVDNEGKWKNFCDNGKANPPHIGNDNCIACKWRWIGFDSEDYPCTPANGKQLIFEDNFNSPSATTIYYKEAFPNNYSALMDLYSYSDWEVGESCNCNFTENPNEVYSYDALIQNVNVTNGALDFRYDNDKQNAPSNVVNDPHFNALGLSLKGMHKFGYGTFEVRCKFPNNLVGLNCPFWLYGKKSTGCGGSEEIDWYETFDYENSGGIYDNNPNKQHVDRRFKTGYLSNTKADCNDQYRCHRKFYSKLSPGDLLSSYHTITGVWTPYQIKISIDGVYVQSIYSFADGGYYASFNGDGRTCNGMHEDSDKKKDYHVKYMQSFPRADLAALVPLMGIHGIYNNSPSSSPEAQAAQNRDSESHMQYDYIKIWQMTDCSSPKNYSGLHSLGCSDAGPSVDYHSGSVLNYSNWTLSSTNYCGQAGEFWVARYNRKLLSRASSEIILGPGTEIQRGTYFDGKIVPCEIDASEYQRPSFLEANNSVENENISNLENETEIKIPNEIKPDIFPNPTSSLITLRSTSASGEFIIRNVLGKDIINGKILSTEQMVNTAFLEPGVYSISFNFGSQIINRKFIKTN